jgi:hypothetical protein
MNGSFIYVVVTLLAAVVSGSLGSTYESYRRRSRPFIVPNGMHNVLRGVERVTLTSIGGRISQGSSFPILPQEGSVAELRMLRRWTYRLIRGGGDKLNPSLVSALGKLQGTPSDASIIEAVSGPLSLQIFDDFVARVLTLGKLSLDGPTNGRTDGLHVVRTPANKGSYAVGIPGDLSFASNLDTYPILEKKLKPFVDSLRALDATALRSSLQSIYELLNQDVGIANSAISEIESTLDSKQRWEYGLYVVNYGESALLVTPRAEIQIRRPTKGAPLIKLAALLVVESTDEDENDVTGVAEKRGLLVAAGSTHKLSFVSSQVQSQMADGNEIAGLFKDGKSEARAVFEYFSSGSRPKRSFNTPWQRFCEENDEEA